MRISANLPYDLQMEMVDYAVYLHNRTPQEARRWKTPYEVFYSNIGESVGIQKKLQLAYLRAYGCRAYAMTKDAQLKQKKKQKLNPQAYIGYLVGYDSTNIFRIWIPHKGKVISTRDVIFDEYTFFDSKLELFLLLKTIRRKVDCCFRRGSAAVLRGLLSKNLAPLQALAYLSTKPEPRQRSSYS